MNNTSQESCNDGPQLGYEQIRVSRQQAIKDLPKEHKAVNHAIDHVKYWVNEWQSGDPIEVAESLEGVYYDYDTFCVSYPSYKHNPNTVCFEHVPAMCDHSIVQVEQPDKPTVYVVFRRKWHVDLEMFETNTEHDHEGVYKAVDHEERDIND